MVYDTSLRDLCLVRGRDISEIYYFTLKYKWQWYSPEGITYLTSSEISPLNIYLFVDYEEVKYVILWNIFHCCMFCVPAILKTNNTRLNTSSLLNIVLEYNIKFTMNFSHTS